LKPADSLDRKRKQAELDRMESEGDKFHQAVYDGYMQLCKREKQRIRIIDALKSVEEIHAEIVECIENRFKERGI
jgi:dTMP kinase